MIFNAKTRDFLIARRKRRAFAQFLISKIQIIWKWRSFVFLKIKNEQCFAVRSIRKSAKVVKFFALLYVKLLLFGA
jgi:hypothetical protein